MPAPADEVAVTDEPSAQGSHQHSARDQIPTLRHSYSLDRSDEEATIGGRLDSLETPPLHETMSRSRIREESNRLNDDIAMLQVERQVSKQPADGSEDMHRTRSRRDDNIDEFDLATNPVHETTKVYTPTEAPTSRFAKFVKSVHNSSWIIRNLTYITPVALILLVPLLLGAFKYQTATVGGVKLMWFMIWLEIVWLALWLGRIVAKCLPWPIGVIASLFTNTSKTWRDMAKQLELAAAIFFWLLAVEISFLPTMTNHQLHGGNNIQKWMSTMNKVLVSFFVGGILNLIEKVIIQLIAISFHLRTYQDRIEINRFQIGSLVKVYEFSKQKLTMEDHEFEEKPSGGASGARTPSQWVAQATKQTAKAVNKFGDAAGRVAGDFTGKAVKKSTHPSQVILVLLNTTAGSQVLARRLYRTFAREETQTIHKDDLAAAFSDEEELEAAFSMFDKDMNGDISMEELEAVCVDIGRERKSITASLKDLDSVIGKLNNVLMFAVLVVVILVFISLISTSAATAITSAGSTLLALSWLFSATAQEFLQSCIFVFIKHPFDVGDRVSVYGNTGDLGRGDDYFVKEISLLYTEFKKMQGHVVQAPNSYLNTLFILNQRRSGGLAEAVPVVLKYGTTLDQLEALRSRLLEFVQEEKREYQANILTELREVTEVHSITMNVIFFYKSNWQNEGLRLARRNKFICALMVTMQELGIEGPRMRYPGMKESFPVYLQNVPHMPTPGAGHGGYPDKPQGWQPEDHKDPDFVAPPPEEGSNGLRRDFSRMTSFRQSNRRRESLAAMNKRVDFSLGAQEGASTNMAGDVFEETRRRLPPQIREVSASRERDSQDRLRPTTSTDTARSTSRFDRHSAMPNHLQRRSTDRGSHRNRFFPRFRANTQSMQEADEIVQLESGLARPSQEHTRHHIDPRTGNVGPLAVHIEDEPVELRHQERTM